MSCLNHVVLTHVRDGVLYDRRFYWKAESHTMRDGELFKEELALLLRNMGIEESNIESISVVQVLETLPANSEPVTLANSL